MPGDNQVAIFWRPSGSETTGDVFFEAVERGDLSSPNLLYDPNYRQYDVEGYRVYRGRGGRSLGALHCAGAVTTTPGVDALGHNLGMKGLLSAPSAPIPTCARPELGIEGWVLWTRTATPIDYDSADGGVIFPTTSSRRSEWLEPLVAGQDGVSGSRLANGDASGAHRPGHGGDRHGLGGELPDLQGHRGAVRVRSTRRPRTTCGTSTPPRHST